MVDMRYFCDRCSERIAADRTTFKPTTGAWRHHDAIDLCASCFDEFRKWIGPGPGRTRRDEDVEAA